MHEQLNLFDNPSLHPTVEATAVSQTTEVVAGGTAKDTTIRRFDPNARISLPQADLGGGHRSAVQGEISFKDSTAKRSSAALHIGSFSSLLGRPIITDSDIRDHLAAHLIAEDKAIRKEPDQMSLADNLLGVVTAREALRKAIAEQN